MGRSPFAESIPFVLAVAVIGLALPASPVSADETFVVDSTADLVDSDLVDIACQTVANTCTLRAAVMQANLNPGNTTILLPAGTFPLGRLPAGANGADNGDLNLAKPNTAGSITIRGAGAAATIVDGGDLDRIFRVESGTAVVLSDMTLRNGTADAGGAIRALGEIQMTGVRLTGNVAQLRGGGLAVEAPVPAILLFCDVDDNRSEFDGGGIYLSPAASSVFTFTYGSIRDNVALLGGGLYGVGPGELTFDRVEIRNNEAETGGGLTFADSDATVFIQSSTLVGNRATDAVLGYGGAIYNDATLYMVNSTLSGNRSKLDGGGLFNSGNADLYNSTVALNEADYDADANGGLGGGLFSHPLGILAIRNSVVAGNFRSGAPVADDCSGNVGAYGHNRFGSFAGCTVSHTGGCGGMDQLLASPSELGPLRYNGGPTPTHAIQPGSGMIDDVDAPCICQDDLADPISVDQRRGPRVAGARCDVGSYEFGALPAGVIFSDGFEIGVTRMWD